jgi:sugar lactone lactonase YvrE
MLWFGLMPLFGASYYTGRPDDSRAVCLEPENFSGLHGDGVGDDTAAIEQAIGKVAQTALGKGVVLIPPGRYRLSHTVQIPPGIRLLGYGTNRPVFVLGAHTPGFQETNQYMIWFTGGKGEDANPGTFYSALANIDFEIQDGNPGAIGIRAYYAQHCYLAHIDFHINGGHAGIGQADNEAEDLHFYGGDYGIMTMRPSPSWQFTLLDSTFEGQRLAAIKSQEAGLTLVRDTFKAVPTAVAIDEGHGEELWMKDCRMQNFSGPALIISNEKNAGTEINVEDTFCERVPTFARFRESGKVVKGDGAMYTVKKLSHGLQLADLGAPAEIRTSFETEKLTEEPPPVPSDIPPLPPVATWTNIRDLGAKGDGETDDLPAFQSAIERAKVVFIPAGRYRVSDSIRLKPDTILIGLNPIEAQIAIADRAPAFVGDASHGYKGVVESSAGGDNIVQGIGIDSGANNPRAVGLKWEAGEHSLVSDVKFLGGHGTLHPDGTRIPPYNANHTGDPNPARHWDSDGPGLLVTQNGGGTFVDIWTASTFAACGVMIEDTTKEGRIYELSSEHHVRNEVRMRNVANWRIYALQTEEEWGESPGCLPLEIQNCDRLTFANLYMFRVLGMFRPFPCGVNVSDSGDLSFRNVHVYSQSKYSFDTPIFDTTRGLGTRYREIAALDISTNAVKSSSRESAVLERGAKVQKLSGALGSIDNAVADSAGNVYVLDGHAGRIYRWSMARHALTRWPADGLEPAALAMDGADDLLVISRRGTAYALNTKDTNGPMALNILPAGARPGLQAVFPASRWYDWHTFLADNLRKNPSQLISPDNSTFIPVPADFLTNDGEPPGIPPIDLLRTYQLTKGDPQHPVFVADEFMHETWKFTVTADGSLSDPKLFAEEGEAGAVQDVKGNVYVAAGNIFVYDKNGRQTGLIEVPERPTSLAFGGTDGRTLFIAARSSLYAVRTKFAGMR